MKNAFKAICFTLIVVILAGLSGCGLTTEKVMNIIAPEETPAPGTDLVFSSSEQTEEKIYELTYNEMDGVFSPFWAEKDGDKSVVELTQLSLLATEGSRSPTEISRSTNDDGSVTVTIHMRDDLKCGNGTALNAEDLLFTYYVLLDMDYDGPYQLKTLPIRGLSAYWNGMDDDLYTRYMAQYEEIYNNGKFDQELQNAVKDARNEAITNGVSEDQLDNDAGVIKAQKALDAYDTENADMIRSVLEELWKVDAENIVRFTVENYSSSISLRTSYTAEDLESNSGIQVMYAMLDRSLGTIGEDGAFTSVSGSVWNLKDSFPTTDDLYNEMVKAYNGDVEQYWMIEGYGRSSMLDKARAQVVYKWATADPLWRGDILSVTGITKKDDTTVTVTLDYCDETVLKTLCGIYVAPLSVYGDSALYRPTVGTYGFTKGDLTDVRAQNAAAMGAGEFVYENTDIREVSFVPNSYYWQGKSEYASAVLNVAK